MIKILSKGGDALREGCLVTDAGKCRTVAFRSGLSWFFFQASSFPHFLVPDCEAKRDFVGVEQVACYSSLPPPPGRAREIAVSTDTSRSCKYAGCYGCGWN